MFSVCTKTIPSKFQLVPPLNSRLSLKVPGFSGWGPPLLGAINYWGGVEDIPKYLTDHGYTVIISTIAPISSNWERACELYAQLRAGK